MVRNKTNQIKQIGPESTQHTIARAAIACITGHHDKSPFCLQLFVNHTVRTAAKSDQVIFTNLKLIYQSCELANDFCARKPNSLLNKNQVTWIPRYVYCFLHSASNKMTYTQSLLNEKGALPK
jgi:hypothetical protein